MNAERGRAPAPATPPAPPATALGVLFGVLERDGQLTSASQDRHRALTDADHLAILNAIWTAETAPAREQRYQDLLAARSISYSAPSSPKRTVPAASPPSRSSISRVCTFWAMCMQLFSRKSMHQRRRSAHAQLITAPMGPSPRPALMPITNGHLTTSLAAASLQRSERGGALALPPGMPYMT